MATTVEEGIAPPTARLLYDTKQIVPRTGIKVDVPKNSPGQKTRLGRYYCTACSKKVGILINYII